MTPEIHIYLFLRKKKKQFIKKILKRDFGLLELNIYLQMIKFRKRALVL